MELSKILMDLYDKTSISVEQNSVIFMSPLNYGGEYYLYTIGFPDPDENFEILEPPSPIIEEMQGSFAADYHFLGWYTEKEGGEEISFPYAPHNTTDTLYAHFEYTDPA